MTTPLASSNGVLIAQQQPQSQQQGQRWEPGSGSAAAEGNERKEAEDGRTASAVLELRARVLQRPVRAHVSDGRSFDGTFLCVDGDKNVILNAAVERRVMPSPTSSSSSSSSSSMAITSVPGSRSTVPDLRSAVDVRSNDPVLSPTVPTVTERPVGMVMIPGVHLVRLEVLEDAHAQPAVLAQGGYGGATPGRGPDRASASGGMRSEWEQGEAGAPLYL